MAFADTASRKLLHGAGGAIVRVAAADGGAVGMSFGLGGLWQLIVGLFGSAARLLVLPFELLWHLLQTAVAGAAHFLLLPFEALSHLLQATAEGISLWFDGLWHLINDFVANLLATVGNAAHVLVMPFEALWHLLQATAAGTSLCFDGLVHIIHGFVANLLATVGNAAHVLVMQFEALCRWLQIAVASVQGIFPSLLATLSNAAHKLVLPFEAFGQWIETILADAATGISIGLDGFWLLIRRSFASVLATLADAADELVLPFKAFGRWMQTIVADAAVGISIGMDGFWPLIRRSFASVLATLAGAADELAPALEVFWSWLKTTAVVALPFVLCIALVLSLVALVWYCLPLLSTAAQLTGKALMSAVVGIAKALVQIVCWSAQYLHVIAMAVGRALSYLQPVCWYCCQCCASATMKAPGAAGFLISRAAFTWNPPLYFQILRSAGSVVASAVFSTPGVAWAASAPVARLFRA